MALDSYDDGVDGGKHLRGGGADAGAAAGRMEPAETRSRQEYYEVLRAADGKPVQGSDDQRGSAEARTDAPARARTDVPAEERTDSPAGARTDAPAEEGTDRSGWDAVDSGRRPPMGAIRITPE